MKDWTLSADGKWWTGPNGEQLRALSGAQDFDPTSMVGDFAGGVGGGFGSDLSSFVPEMSQSGMAPFSFGGGGGGGGFGSFFSDLSGIAKQAIPFLQLGTQGLGAYGGIRGMMEAGRQNENVAAAQKTAQAAAAPALAAGQQLIPAGTQALMGGQLPPALESTVNQWMNNWRAQIRQFAARSGIDASTMLAQYEGLIQSQAQELRAQLAQGLLSAGTGALQPAIQGAQVGGQLASHQGDATSAAIQAANQALARLMGSQ